MFGNFALSGSKINIGKMKLFEKPRNIYDAVYPFYLILKLFGFVSFSFKESLDGVQIVTTIYDTIYFIGIFIVYVAMFSTLFFRSFGFPTDSVVFRQGTLILLFFEILTVIIGITYQFLKKKNLKKFLEILHEFDGMVSDLFCMIYNGNLFICSFQTSENHSITDSINYMC